ncbi:hypothetical protein [Salinicola tamaricis]|uniref:hypothetical protein n=1 Tax=Salinicola tamaricis TaxID=1771309 RepID=UPI000D0A6432|nr:hypothetical protein [Salinicola tamaricis]
MVATGFSAFESLLVKSPHQRESAELLLCWVFANKHVPLDEDRRYLERLAARAHHRRDLETLLAAARRQDLGDVQLAAEVLTKEQSGPIIAFLRRAVVVATSDGALSLRNHHILRFLADLCEVSPDTLRALYREVTGRALAAPEDLSHRSHWQPPSRKPKTPQRPKPATPARPRRTPVSLAPPGGTGSGAWPRTSGVSTSSSNSGDASRPSRPRT